MDTLLWVVAVVLIVAGVAGTILPALPGTALAFAGILLAAWIDDFARVTGWTVMICGLLMLLAWGADYASAMVGAKKAGASKLAVAGAAIGTVAGIFTGFIGLLFMPLVGAAVGEYLSDRDAARAAHVGVATWIGLLIGTIVKVVITFVMIGLFVAALLIA
ncbi:MAG: DUF456 domain-containing protein [Burkholderiales bacterium]|nr:MAG: DUF456 domain-containing protein [Burkholderiales bacterium]